MYRHIHVVLAVARYVHRNCILNLEPNSPFVFELICLLVLDFDFVIELLLNLII